MFEELLRRLPDIALAGPVERLRSNFINGIKRMPIRFTPERARARAQPPGATRRWRLRSPIRSGRISRSVKRQAPPARSKASW